MTINENLPPSFAVADPSRNWIEVSDVPVVYSPREIISTAQAVAGVTPDGNWGTGTSDALIATARQRGLATKWIAALEKAKADRRLNIDAFRVAYSIAYTVPPETVKFGRRESDVRLPTYGAVAPGRSVTETVGGEQPVRPASPPTTRAPVVRPPSPPAPTMSTTKKVAIGVAALVAVGAAAAAVVYVYKGDQPKSMPMRPAARRPPPRTGRVRAARV